MSWEASEAERRLANVVRLGVITQLDPAAARVKVKTAGIESDWLPWATSRAGGDRTWHPPEPGEQVVLLSPQGDLGQGVVLPSIYQQDHPAPGDRPSVSRTTYADGASLAYDRDAHKWSLEIPAGGAFEVTIGGTTLTIEDGKVTIKAADLHVEGDVKATGDVVAGSVSLKQHLHTGVMSGPALTGPPQQ